MNFYVISPNVYNDGENYAKDMFDKKIAAVGWDKDKPKGKQFKGIANDDCIIVAQRKDWEWTYYYMGIVIGDEENPSVGTLSKKLSPIVSLENKDLDFNNWTANGSNQISSPQRIDIDNKANAIIANNIKKIFNMQKYIDILRANHNLILTGAPGTGKTYLAKQIAKGMGCTDDEIGFVQFHPSYDYTDFVEGIRPNDNNGFERRDGVFIKFCNKALMNIENSKKKPDVLSMENSVKKKYEYLLSKIDAGEIQEVTLRTNKKMLVDKISNNKNIILKANQTTTTTHTVSLNRILKLSEKFHDKNSLDNISNINTEITDVIGGCNASAYWAVLHLVYEQELEILSNSTSETKKYYVFIIDEINRGEISKIFGELFYSIDPGYRGKDGKVKTQYASMQHEPNDFDVALGIKDRDECGWFFVPENVYIIGTMNDIDRSVESMDFAFRRRFAFVEIKADENVGMLDDLEWKADAIKRMKRLNKAISDTEGLSSAYHIGASYFLKLKNYNGDFNQLWEYHLEGLLHEYLRGMQGVEDSMKKLKNAYDNANPSNGQ